MEKNDEMPLLALRKKLPKRRKMIVQREALAIERKFDFGGAACASSGYPKIHGLPVKD